MRGNRPKKKGHNCLDFASFSQYTSFEYEHLQFKTSDLPKQTHVLNERNDVKDRKD